VIPLVREREEQLAAGDGFRLKTYKSDLTAAPAR
jgi:hypothetical protein